MTHLIECRLAGEFCPLCYSGLKGRAVYKGHYGYRKGHKRRKQCMSLARRTSGEGAAGPSPAAIPEKGYWASLSDLLLFMQQQKWEDGTSRLTGTVMLFTEDGAWKCWLHDRDCGQGCFATAVSLEGLLKAANAIVGGGGGEWRPDKARGGKRG